MPAELATVTVPGMRLALTGVVVLAAASLGSGCSEAEGGAAATSRAEPPVTTSATSSSAPTAPTPPPPTTAGPTAPVTQPPGDTGVPGIDDPDAFCAAWARFSGSVQIIAVASAFGGMSSLELAGLELTAAPSIVDAVDAIAEHWPAGLAVEHDAAVDSFLGPFRRRAEHAVEALRGAAVSDAELSELRAAWDAVVRTRDPEVPVVEPKVAASLQVKLDAGSTAFDAALNPFRSDPSLSVGTDRIPLTIAYLASSCPDLASSGVGDDV